MNILNCTCGNRLGDLAPLVLRVTTGFIFLVHGWMKFTGGVEGVAGMLAGLGFPVPMLMAVLLIAAEVLGGLALIFGLYSHWAAKILAFVALVALLTVHASKGFLVSDGGYEFILLLFASSVSLAITGAGRWSLDHGRRKH